jgi:hypothetical protein
MECLGLHNKPTAEVHPGHKLTGPKEEEEEEQQQQQQQQLSTYTYRHLSENGLRFLQILNIHLGYFKQFHYFSA